MYIMYYFESLVNLLLIKCYIIENVVRKQLKGKNEFYYVCVRVILVIK